MPEVPHGMLEKLNFVRQMGDRSCANAIDVDIGPPKMRDVSHGILEKLNNMRSCRCRASANAINKSKFVLRECELSLIHI